MIVELNDRFGTTFVIILTLFAFGSECDINLSYDVNLGPTPTDHAGDKHTSLGKHSKTFGRDEAGAFQLKVVCV